MVFSDGWMDGWMDGWVDGWMGGWMDGINYLPVFAAGAGDREVGNV